ncbi:thiol peroxidase (plasmid) [Nostoc sp. C057]|uniref:thiol peroxidase n=1 Tax=Nostoc sp. C057 TaxID=2576903 RepID=UPI0015C33033|nr:thiol peroxidase [Nostoc sp. C057]QLE52703.1 thiol peroxidase [Nostoc sp. C057]
MVTFHSQPVTLVGLKLKEGDMARDIRVSGSDLSPVLPLDCSRGKVRLFLTLPSLDTPVCAIVTKKFSNALKGLGNTIVAYAVSADLPFAQSRWCVSEGIENIIMLSDYRSMDFARGWGLLIQELGLLTRAIYVVDQSGKVTYREIVPEIASEPNYDAAIAAIWASM